MWDYDTGRDAYIFYSPDAYLKEQDLPELDSAETIECWIRDCPHKVIMGEGDFTEPKAWLRHFEVTNEPQTEYA
jgi:hypothetical protein